MPDILDDYREWAAEQPQQVSTHSDRCHMWPRHEACMIHRLAAALEAARLTDAEREAVGNAAAAMQAAADELGLSQADCERMVATLRGLLERHCPTPENQPQQDNAHQTHSTTVEGRVRHGWIPVGERLPEDGEQVLAYFQTHEVGEAVYIKEVNGFEDDRGGCWDASHWMPLPEPPEVKQ